MNRFPEQMPESSIHKCMQFNVSEQVLTKAERHALNDWLERVLIDFACLKRHVEFINKCSSLEVSATGDGSRGSSSSAGNTRRTGLKVGDADAEQYFNQLVYEGPGGLQDACLCEVVSDPDYLARAYVAIEETQPDFWLDIQLAKANSEMRFSPRRPSFSPRRQMLERVLQSGNYSQSDDVRAARVRPARAPKSSAPNVGNTRDEGRFSWHVLFAALLVVGVLSFSQIFSVVAIAYLQSDQQPIISDWDSRISDSIVAAVAKLGSNGLQVADAGTGLEFHSARADGPSLKLLHMQGEFQEEASETENEEKVSRLLRTAERRVGELIAALRRLGVSDTQILQVLRDIAELP